MGIQVFSFSVFFKILRDSNSQNFWFICDYQYNSTGFQKLQPEMYTSCNAMWTAENSACPQLLWKSAVSKDPRLKSRQTLLFHLSQP